MRVIDGGASYLQLLHLGRTKSSYSFGSDIYYLLFLLLHLGGCMYIQLVGEWGATVTFSLLWLLLEYGRVYVTHSISCT